MQRLAFPRGAPARTASDLVASTLLVASSAVTFVLFSAYLAENGIFGVVLLGIGTFQL